MKQNLQGPDLTQEAVPSGQSQKDPDSDQG